MRRKCGGVSMFANPASFAAGPHGGRCVSYFLGLQTRPAGRKEIGLRFYDLDDASQENAKEEARPRENGADERRFFQNPCGLEHISLPGLSIGFIYGWNVRQICRNGVHQRRRWAASFGRRPGLSGACRVDEPLAPALDRIGIGPIKAPGQSVSGLEGWPSGLRQRS